MSNLKDGNKNYVFKLDEDFQEHFSCQQLCLFWEEDPILEGIILLVCTPSFSLIATFALYGCVAIK